MSIKNLAFRHPLTAYFMIVLGWIGLYTLLAFRFIPPDLPDGLGSVPVWLMILLMFGMPSVIGLLLTAWIEGKSGLKSLLGRLGQWQVQPVALTIAILCPVCVYALAFWLQGFLGGPSPIMRWGGLAAGLGSGLFSGPFEELGWRGFVLPRLLQRQSPMKAALLTGLGWGSWHFMINYVGMRQYGSWMLELSFMAGPVLLTGFTVLMTWVYLQARASLLVMVLFHVCITTNAIFFSLPAPTLVDTMRHNLLLCLVVWLVVALLVALGGFRPSQHAARSPQQVNADPIVK